MFNDVYALLVVKAAKRRLLPASSTAFPCSQVQFPEKYCRQLECDYLLRVSMRARRFQPTDVVIAPSELEFLAEEELVTIISSVSTTEVDESGNSGYLSLLAGKCGKFVPNQELNVPLWLAIELRRRNQCQVQVPPWMTVAALRDTINSERNEKTFQPLPFRYIEVSKLLLTHAKEDMGSSYFKTRDLLTSLQTLRMRKIIEGIKEIQGPVTITLRDLSAFELNQVRHVFLHGMDNFHELAEAVQNTQGNPETDAADAGGVLDGGGALL